MPSENENLTPEQELEENLEYVRPEEKLYTLAVDKNSLDWKSFLYDLINKEGLDPWDIDLKVLTQKYLEAIKSLQDVDFNISGKLLTVAVFLLKTKAQTLLDKDIRGIEQKFNSLNSEVDLMAEFDQLEDFSQELDLIEAQKPKKEKYSIKVRNPLARKRKVNIFDLIKTLEKTFEQSNRRRVNFFLKNKDVKYKGPTYEKKKKDLKTVIAELLSLIQDEFSQKSGHISFNHITKEVDHKEGVLEKFIPLLHLHNQNEVYVKQEKHFGEIQIHENHPGNKEN